MGERDWRDFDHTWLEEFYQVDLSKWAQATFGSDQERGPIGPLKHLIKEVQETMEDPSNIVEWADCMIILFDGCRRAGHTFRDLVGAMRGKHQVNVTRKWPKADSGNPEPIEHVREEEKAQAPEIYFALPDEFVLKLIDSLPPYEGGSLLRPNRPRDVDWIDPEVLGLEDDGEDL